MKTAESAFYYSGPITPGKKEPYLEPTIVPTILNDLTMQQCCLLIGPPGSGTSTTVRAVEQRLFQKQPETGWWLMDLNLLPTGSNHQLFQELAIQGAKRFPEQQKAWLNLAQLGESALSIDKRFCETLIRSVRQSRQRYVLVVDHIENVDRDIAKTVIASVRSLHTNWDRSKLGPRMITTLLAGSHRLRRQGMQHGSPLNFAKKHFLPELDHAQSLRLLKKVKADKRQRFTHGAAAYLAEMTAGDRYLLQRLGQICLDAAQNQNDDHKVNIKLARRMVDEFILTGYRRDPKLTELVPELIKDPNALFIVRWFLDNPNRELDPYWLESDEITAGIMRLLQIKDNHIRVRNKIYQQILVENGPIIESAYELHKINDKKIDRMAKFTELIAQADVASESNEALQELLKEIAEFFEVEVGVSLMYYDAVAGSYKVEATHPPELKIISEIPDKDGNLRENLSNKRKTDCLAYEKLCSHCNEKKRGSCSWLSLDLTEGTQHMGALILYGSQNWEMSYPKKQESTILLSALASILLTRQRRRGLALLSEVRVSQVSDNDIQEQLCRSVASLFNRQTVYLWDGSQKGRYLSLKSSTAVNSPGNNDLDVKAVLQILGKCENIVVKEYSFILENVQNETIIQLMRQLSLESLALSCFKYGDNRLGVVGIGSTRPWQPSKTEQTLFHLVGERVQTTFSNMHYIDQLKRRMDASKHAAHLLSHELKNEPARILREIEILTKGGRSSTIAERQEELERISKWAQDHQAIVDRVVLFAQLDANIWHLGPLEKQSLNAITQKLLGEIHEELENETYECRYEPSPQEMSCYIDEFSMRLILKNLIQNANQYAPDTVIQVKTWGENGTNYLSVADNGPGVELIYQPSLFNAFDRGRFNETRTARQGNLGLGLYLVQELMKLHGGRVVYDADYREGARFILAFPPNEGGGLNGTPSVND